MIHLYCTSRYERYRDGNSWGGSAGIGESLIPRPASFSIALPKLPRVDGGAVNASMASVRVEPVKSITAADIIREIALMSPGVSSLAKQAAAIDVQAASVVQAWEGGTDGLALKTVLAGGLAKLTGASSGAPVVDASKLPARPTAAPVEATQTTTAEPVKRTLPVETSTVRPQTGASLSRFKQRLSAPLPAEKAKDDVIPAAEGESFGLDNKLELPEEADSSNPYASFVPGL